MCAKSIKTNKKTPNLSKEERFRAFSSQEYRDYVRFLCEKCDNEQISPQERDTELTYAFEQRRSYYMRGGDGAVQFIEENCRIITIDPKTRDKIVCFIGELPAENFPTGKNWKGLWEHQREIIRNALALNAAGELKHNLLVICTPRGEGKSFIAGLIMQWKMFVWDEMSIMMVANTKDQVGHVHAKEIKKTIAVSPSLLALIGGERYLIDKQFERRKDGRVTSYIKPASAMTGLFSGINAFGISEYFKSKDKTFFDDAYSSMRATPDAFGIIDSTVAPRGHHLHSLYLDSIKEVPENPMLFFHYESNPEGTVDALRNPLTTPESLAAFRTEMAATPGAYEAYFCNDWAQATSGLFTNTDIKATSYFGVDGYVKASHTRIREAIEKIEDNERKDNEVRGRGVELRHSMTEINREIEESLMNINDYISLTDGNGNIINASADELSTLGDILRTDWVIGVGADSSDPLKKSRDGANTVMCCVAKGMIGSRDLPFHDKIDIPKYIYVLLHAEIPIPDDLPILQGFVNNYIDEYNGIDSYCSDRVNAAYMVAWLQNNDITKKAEGIHFSPQKQQEVFTNLHECISQGRLILPRVPYPSIHGAWEDVLKEELSYFSYEWTGASGTYGSTEKGKPGGVQDDFIDAVSMAIYGMRHLGVQDFRSIEGKSFFGAYYDPVGELKKGSLF